MSSPDDRRNLWKRAPRRRRLSASVVLAAALLAAGLLAGACAAGCAGGAAQVEDSSPVSASPEAAASPSPAATPSEAVASPSPSPTPPPLRKPTKKDPLRVYFGGDSLAGMPGVMLRQLTAKNGLAKVRPDYVVSSRLTYDDPVDWPARVRQQMAAGRVDVGVFMIGGNDTGMPMLVEGESTWYPKKKWLDEYERRAMRIAILMLRGGAERVYWVGMPVMPDAAESARMRKLNELFENVARRSPDVVYVDSYELLSTKNGDLDASLRSGDGVHYTNEGAQVVAEAVWEAMKRDWQPR